MSTDQRSSPPPISVAHLLTLTFGVAIALGIQVRSIDLSREAFNLQSLQFFQLVFVVCSSLVSGLAVAGLFWLYDWRRRKGPFSLQPGHWLVICYGLTFLAVSAIQLIVFSLFELGGFEQNSWLSWSMIVPALLQFGLSMAIYGLALTRTSGVWRVVMATLLLQSMSDLLWMIMVMSGTGLSIMQASHYAAAGLQFLPILFLMIAVGWELIIKRRRDWIHYCGVALPLAMFLIQVGSGIYYRFLYQ